jgi:hypothetical protein
MNDDEIRASETAAALQAGRLEQQIKRAAVEDAVKSYNEAGLRVGQLQTIHAEALSVLDLRRQREALSAAGFAPRDETSLALHDAIRAFQKSCDLLSEGGLMGPLTRTALAIE